MTSEYVEGLIREGERAMTPLGSLRLNDPMYVRKLVRELTEALSAVKQTADHGPPGQ